jgi:putative transposase
MSMRFDRRPDFVARERLDARQLRRFFQRLYNHTGFRRTGDILEERPAICDELRERGSDLRDSENRERHREPPVFSERSNSAGSLSDSGAKNRRTERKLRATPVLALVIQQLQQRGEGVADLVRTHGITEHTYYRWKAKYGGMELSEMQRLKQLEDENRRLKQIVAEQTLDIQALKAVVAKKW